MSRKPRPEKPEAAEVARTVLTGVVYTPVPNLKPGDHFKINSNLIRVDSNDNTGAAIRISVAADGMAFHSAIHQDDLEKLFPKGVPVHTVLNQFSGTVEIPKAGDPMTITMGQTTGLLADVLRQIGKAEPGEKYKVTFEQVPEVK